MVEGFCIISKSIQKLSFTGGLEKKYYWGSREFLGVRAFVEEFVFSKVGNFILSTLL